MEFHIEDKDNIEDVNKRLDIMEKLIEEKNTSIKKLETKIEMVESENKSLKNEINGMLGEMKIMTEKIVKDTVDTVVAKLNNLQVEKEKHTDIQFQALEQQVAILVNHVKSSPSSALVRPKSSLPELQIKIRNPKNQSMKP